MHPTLVRWETGVSWLGTMEITSYFAAVTVAFVLGTILFWRWARATGVDGNDALDLVIWLVVSGLLGAKLLHVIADGIFMDYVNICIDPSKVFWDRWSVSPAECRELGGNAVLDAAGNYAGCVPTERNCFAWVNLFAGGYTFYGGLLAAGATAFVFIRRRGLPLWPAVDALTWIVMLGLAIGRIGCFLNGCCFGGVTGSWWGIVFPRGSPAWVLQAEQGLIREAHPPLPVHPTQIVEGVVVVALAAFLRFYVLPRRRYEGEVFVAGLALYAVLRIFIEFLRADPRGDILGVSTSQIIGLGVIAGAYLIHRRLGRATPRPAPL